MAVLTSPDTYSQEPERAWQRLRARVRRPRELAVLMEVAAWREREAQARDLPRQRVLKDDALIEIAQQQPKDADELGRLRALPKGYERSRAGEAIVAAVSAGLARDTKTLPRITRDKPLSNGASATVELLKVLLRMTSEKHGVAAKVIATVDDLERIASDDNPDVPAMRGWRREMFGNEALKLKRGGVALAVEAGRVVAIDRDRTH
jgi:ribonuclease D